MEGRGVVGRGVEDRGVEGRGVEGKRVVGRGVEGRRVVGALRMYTTCTHTDHPTHSPTPHCTAPVPHLIAQPLTHTSLHSP